MPPSFQRANIHGVVRPGSAYSGLDGQHEAYDGPGSPGPPLEAVGIPDEGSCVVVRGYSELPLR